MWTLLLACAFATASPAQTLRVQSGDHPDFTRLVIPIGADRTYTLSGEGRTWRLRVDPGVDGFDIAGVFDLIARDRLASLSADAALTLSLACDCEIESYRFRDRYVVIDIADPADPSALEQDAAEEERRAAAAAALPDLTDLLTRGGEAPTAEPWAQAARANPASDIALEQAAAIMAEQLARAAASGLLEAELGRPISDADPEMRRPAMGQDTTSATTDGPEPPRASPHPARTEPQGIGGAVEALGGPRPVTDTTALPIRAETAFDAARHADAGAEPQRPSLACTGQSLDVTQWANGTGVDHGLGVLRLALFDDRDQLRREAAIDLARHYLFYGFGAEAEFWLNQIDAPPQTLVILARFLDGEGNTTFPTVTDPLGCSEDELFWRYVTGSVDHLLSDEQIGAIQRYHAGLPTVLRDHLGPDLARRLAGDNQPSAARNVVETLARGGRLPPSAMSLLDLDLGIAQPSEALRTVLTEALEADGATPADTMAHALSVDVATGQRPTAERLTAAEALLRETPQSATRDALWGEVVVAHAERGNIDRAIAMVADAGTVDAQTQQTVITRLLENRLDAGDTAGLSVVAHMFGSNWRATGSDAGRVRVAAIAHLQDAGLWRAAGALRNSQRPLILPAREAPPIDEGVSLANAWASRDWTLLAERTRAAEQDLAIRMLAGTNSTGPLPGLVPAAPEVPPDLSSLSQLLSDSRDLRSTIMALLPAAPTR